MLDHLNTHRLVFFVFDSRARDMYAGPIRGLGGPIPMSGQGQDCMVSGETISICMATGVSFELSGV